MRTLPKGLTLRTVRLRLLTFAALTALPVCVGAQATRCSAMRSTDGTFRGACTRNDSTVARLEFQRPSAAEPYLWKGTATTAVGSQNALGSDSGRLVIVGSIVDIRPRGALRLAREWLFLSDVHGDSMGLTFVYDPTKRAPTTSVDADIIRGAGAYLRDSSRWNSADDTDMDSAPVKGFNCQPTVARSMFCALYLASVEFAGDYAHFRPAMNAVRDAIASAAKRPLRHPLVDFNNDPTTSLRDVHAVLDAALKRVQEEVGRGGAQQRVAVDSRAMVCSLCSLYLIRLQLNPTLWL